MSDTAFIVMKQSKRFSDSPAFIQFVSLSEENAKAFIKKAQAADDKNFYYIDDREIEQGTADV